MTQTKSPHSPITPENATERIGEVMLPDVYPLIVDLERSQGNRLFDSKGCRFFLDCFSFIASNPIGHNHPKLFEPEFERTLLRAARTKPSCSDFHTVEMAQFVEAFRRVAMRDPFCYLFFVEGGAVAIENAMKTAFDWKVRKNQARGITDREVGTKILHFEQAFHGRCGYTLTVTNTADPKKTKYFPKFNWPRVHNPKCSFPMTGDVVKQVMDAEAKAVAAIEKAFVDNLHDIAAIIIEPIQAEGGDNHFRPEFHHSLRRLADQHEAMLIYDEVQSGVGITGKMWAYEHYGITPDIVVFGKKMQVCGMMVGPRVKEVENHVFIEPSRINSTWGGSLVDMVRATKYLQIIEEEKLVENAAKVGDYLLKELEKLSTRYPELMRNARGKGLMCAIDLETPELRDQMLDEIFERGALILKCGETSLRFRPSLNFTKGEVDELIGIVEGSLRALKKLADPKAPHHSVEHVAVEAHE